MREQEKYAFCEPIVERKDKANHEHEGHEHHQRVLDDLLAVRPGNLCQFVSDLTRELDDPLTETRTVLAGLAPRRVRRLTTTAAGWRAFVV
jgi:hypothetical protein